MCEDVARTVHIARQLGAPLPIEQDDIDALHERYQNVYGQRSSPTGKQHEPLVHRRPEVWFLTGSQGMYGAETLEQVAAAVPGSSPTGWQSRPSCRSRVVWKPVLLDCGVDPPR